MLYHLFVYEVNKSKSNIDFTLGIYNVGLGTVTKQFMLQLFCLHFSVSIVQASSGSVCWE